MGHTKEIVSGCLNRIVPPSPIPAVENQLLPTATFLFLRKVLMISMIWIRNVENPSKGAEQLKTHICLMSSHDSYKKQTWKR